MFEQVIGAETTSFIIYILSGTVCLPGWCFGEPYQGVHGLLEAVHALAELHGLLIAFVEEGRHFGVRGALWVPFRELVHVLIKNRKNQAGAEFNRCVRERERERKVKNGCETCNLFVHVGAKLVECIKKVTWKSRESTFVMIPLCESFL
jgi:hypothetical protein